MTSSYSSIHIILTLDLLSLVINNPLLVLCLINQWFIIYHFIIISFLLSDLFSFARSHYV